MILGKLFDKYFKEEDFIKLSSERLKEFGFNYHNTIAGVCLCRDEICQSILTEVKKYWGDFFNFSSFAGIYISGQIGLKVFLSHLPEAKERRCLLYLFTHIGIDKDGNLGFCKRKGIEKSTACGALILFLNTLSNIDKEKENSELNLVNQKLRREISDKIPDLMELTKITLRISFNEIEKTMEALAKSDEITYAIVSGIQVHYLDKNYVVPMDSFIFMNNKKISLEF
ncbi:MAG: hypothetical protein NZ845_03035 [Thermodesulfovibrio sp.]|nr:hypothetical protein [Thermodesulfovibrio sp.]